MIKAMADIDVKLGLRTIMDKIEEASRKRTPELQSIKIQLVAVSKTKPPEMIIQAYEAGQRHFGENYVNELVEKANNSLILEKCKDIKWHYIGNLQSNKVNKVLSLPNLYIVETVDSEKLATKLNSSWPKFQPNTKLNVMLQVNTSGEKEKNGIAPGQIINVAKYVFNNCNNLRVDGIMTIGRFGYNLEEGPNPDFICLKQCRDDICKELGLDWKTLNLSMGMSDDFEHAVRMIIAVHPVKDLLGKILILPSVYLLDAIELGSTNVRIGSSIFGYRPKKTT